jgi:hypothetical protein
MIVFTEQMARRRVTEASINRIHTSYLKRTE